MKKAFFLLLTGMGAVLFSFRLCPAGAYQAMAIQKAALYGDQVEVPEAEKNHLISRGQEYLRYYLRDTMLRPMASRWLAVDETTLQTGFKLDLENIYTPDSSDEKNIPFHAQMNVYADEDLQHYLDCGYLIPIEVEMQSDYQVTSQIRLQAKIEAPFNDVMRFQLGSSMQWNQIFTSFIQYKLSNSSDIYEGMTLGMGVHFSDWRCRLNYELAPDSRHVQHVSLARDF